MGTIFNIHIYVWRCVVLQWWRQVLQSFFQEIISDSRIFGMPNRWLSAKEKWKGKEKLPNKVDKNDKNRVKQKHMITSTSSSVGKWL